MLSGLVCAGAGAAAGWWGWGQVTYRAEGAVRLGIEQDTAGASGGGGTVGVSGDRDSGVLRLDEVIERELETLRGLAGQDIEYESTGRVARQTPDGLVIDAYRAPDAATRLVVTATAHDPATAEAALRSVLAAYRATTALTGDAERTASWRSAYQQLNAARAEAAAARSRLADGRRAMSEVGGATGEPSVDRQSAKPQAAAEKDGVVSAVTSGGSSGGTSGGGELEVAWAQANWTLNEAQQAAEAVGRRVEALREMAPATVREVVALDPEAAAWRAEQREIDAELADAVWPPNPSAAALLTQRTNLAARLMARAADTRILPIGDGGLVFRAARLSEAEARRDGLREDQRRAEEEVARLAPPIATWRKLIADAEAAEARLAAQESALTQLDPGSGVRLVGAQIVGSDFSFGNESGDGENASSDPAPPPSASGSELPRGVAVWHDGRPEAAGLGAAIGWLAGAGLCGLLFLLDPRVRRTRDGGLVGSAVPVLGAVPTVDDAASGAGNRRADTTQEIESIQSVRAVLEGKMREGETEDDPGTGASGAFAVVGVGQGSGTTSVAVGLAASMALSGSRVLLIDLAWLQKPAGSSGDDAQATRAGLGIDGVIEELGYLEDEDRELIMLGSGSEYDPEEVPAVGFGAMLSGASLRRSVVQTRLPGLAVLSAMGRGEALREQWAGRVSSRWLSKLMQVSRRGGYTATILDAGSATGSVEGMLGCAAADGTVVVVSQPESQADYDQAVTRLRLVGATILGTVLNRSDAPRLGRGKKHAATKSRRAGGLGTTSGSGIFAAAIEARSGKTAGSTDGSGLIGAPLPRIEDDATDPLTTSESAARSARTIAEDTRGDSVFGVESPSIPPGVDPLNEPPADRQPTPVRTPPPNPPPTPAPVHAETPQPPAETSDEPGDEPTPELPIVPEVQVADDVMDQLVDHAIRAAAKRPRPASPVTPPTDDAP